MNTGPSHLTYEKDYDQTNRSEIKWTANGPYRARQINLFHLVFNQGIRLHKAEQRKRPVYE